MVNTAHIVVLRVSVLGRKKGRQLRRPGWDVATVGDKAALILATMHGEKLLPEYDPSKTKHSGRRKLKPDE